MLLYRYNNKFYEVNILKLEEAKYFRLFSDMHLDFYANSKKFNPSQLWEPEVLPEDKDSVLILAGDIWHAKKPFKFSNYSWFSKICSRFKYVLVVLGNHDFWAGSFPTEYSNFERYKKEQNLNNLFLLQDNVIEIGNYKFLGATFWTSLGSRSHDVIEQFNAHNNDLKYIRWIDPRYPNVYKHITFKPFLEAHNKSKNFIFENAVKDYPEQQIVVVTHHPPTNSLANDPHKTEIDFEIDSNNLFEDIKNSEIDYWMHGHHHQSGVELVGNTKIMANTVGYLSSSISKGDYDPGFNPWHQIEMKPLINNYTNKKHQP